MIDSFLLSDVTSVAFVARLRRFWWALAAFYLTVLADFGLYLASHGKPSRALLALTVAFVVLTLIVAGIASLLTSQRRERVRGWVAPLRGLIGPLLLAALFAFGMIMRAPFVYAHAGLALTLSAALAWVTLVPPEMSGRQQRLWLIGLIAVVLIAVGGRVYALNSYPNVSVIDEPWNLSWSTTYLQTGQVSEFTMVGQPGEPMYYSTTYIPRWPILVAWWMKLVGVGLWQARLFSVIALVPVIGLTALAARNLYGRWTALFTAAAMFSSAILMVALRLRHDVGLALAVALSLWLYSEALKRDRAWLHLLAGLVVGWGGFAHYHALGFAPALFVALYLPRYVSAWHKGQRWPERGAWLYLLGLIVGLGCVALMQVLPDVHSFLVNRQPRNPSSLSEYLRVVVGYVGELGTLSWFETLLIGLGLLAALWRRRVTDLALVLGVVLCHLALAVMTRLLSDTYPTPIAPFYGLLIGSMLGTTLSGPKPSNRLIALVAGLCFVMPVFGQTLKTPLRDVITRKPVITPTPAVDQWVLDHVPTRSVVMGENADYLWLHDYHFYALWLLDFVPPGLLETFPSRADFLLSLKPDVIVFHPDISTYGVLKPMLDDPAYLPTHGYQRVAEFPGASGPALVYARDGVVAP